jgi:hypothetical protein
MDCTATEDLKMLSIIRWIYYPRHTLLLSSFLAPYPSGVSWHRQDLPSTQRDEKYERVQEVAVKVWGMDVLEP